MRSIVSEPRVVMGIALMCAATLLGGLYLQHAAKRVAVWQLTHDVSAGMRLLPEDLRVASVAIDAPGGTYLPTSTDVTGRSLARALASGELLPAAALRMQAPEVREVSIPVDRLHADERLQRGQRVDVWWSSEPDGNAPIRTTRVLSAARVVDVRNSDVGAGSSVIVAVGPASVAPLVQALRSGRLDLVVVRGAR